MSPYMLGEAANQISPEHPPIYDLYATVNHYGSVYIGHYVAFVHPPSPVRKEKGKNGKRTMKTFAMYNGGKKITWKHVFMFTLKF